MVCSAERKKLWDLLEDFFREGDIVSFHNKHGEDSLLKTISLIRGCLLSLRDVAEDKMPWSAEEMTSIKMEDVLAFENEIRHLIREFSSSSDNFSPSYELEWSGNFFPFGRDEPEEIDMSTLSLEELGSAIDRLIAIGVNNDLHISITVEDPSTGSSYEISPPESSPTI